MPKVRKKKTPVTTNRLSTSSGNSQSSRTLIRRFHVLLKRQEQLKHAVGSPANAKALAKVQHEFENLGGLAAYQRMSHIGQGNDRGGGSEKVLIGWLQDLGMAKSENSNKLRLLEVGALKPDNYASCQAWIAATPIDLRSRHPDIMEQDFFLMDLTEHLGKWDVLSLSLVVNFVPEPKNRGHMLSMTHTMLTSGGLLFLVLPLPCVENSRYFNFEKLEALMIAIGFIEIKRRWRSGGKMAYWLYKKTDDKKDLGEFRKKVICRQGDRNNFVILLR
ncbi:nucleolus protein [Hygrophoropsis aurantiaca]|uniref:Nucleolus protein n=1 Tax=Hygrophoropsis aurantiaca TaxID=72124 RepID=A0ACB8ABR4_9AGAM|nr:nucleolus protein [Hygrophoropsis aurantiaca]